MTALFGIALLAGFAMLIVWIVAASVANTVQGWQRVDPELLVGAKGRAVVAGTVGFGMAGLSSFYAGWPSLVSLATAAIGSGVLVVVGIWLGPQREA